MRETVGGSYIRPDKERVDKMIEALKANESAMDYLRVKRGLSQETIEHFNLGYDEKKDAISIPEYKNGELINIRYRYLDEDRKGPKYTQEKDCEVWLYNDEGISIGQKKGGVLVVEGQFDLMSAWQAGFPNVISPSSGKDSYGVWLELVDTIPKVYIAFDNDKPGIKASREMAERVGEDKSFEVQYPEDVKDANEYFQKYTHKDFRQLLKDAKPCYKHKFAGVQDVIEMMREKTENTLKLKTIPFVEFEDDWLTILSGVSNAGKTTVGMNIASELMDMKIPTLILPFERGTKTVGKRFLQVRHNKTQGDFNLLNDEGWEKVIRDSMNMPLYFSMPGKDDIQETIAQAKRFFGVKVCIIDHLDYLVRKSSENHNVETSNTLQEFKALAQEHQMIFIVIHHIRKQDNKGGVPKKPKMEDLKGSSSVYQDPEAVIMLSSPEPGELEIDIVKNKGEMGSKVYEFNLATGKIGREITGLEAQDNWANGSLDDFD